MKNSRKNLQEPKERDQVRKLDEKEGSPDKYATINCIYPDGKIWVANLNMPYMGSISTVYSREEFDKTFELVK